MEFEILKNTEPKNQKSALLCYCKKNIQDVDNNQITIEQASYNICGATNFLFDNIMPEFEEVMNIACDLELPTEHRDRPLDEWEKMKDHINNIKI